MLSFRVLGPIECHQDERRLDVGGPRQIALLAVLLLHANQAASADRLIDALWQDPNRAGSAKRLQMGVARLRKSLEASGEPSRLRTVSGGYLLSVEPGELDADVFEEDLREGRRALDAEDPARAAEVLAGALALWRGPALAEIAFEAFAQGEIRRLHELRIAALEARVEADLRLGRHAAVIGELEALVDEHPTQEHLTRSLMLALYRSGRQVDALDVFQRVRTRLADELGLEPSRALTTMQAQVLNHDAALDLHGSRRTSPARSLALPATATLGRDDEFARLRAVLLDPAVRLVSVVGPGGVGKTRVAIEAARAAAESFGDGAEFVPLAALDAHQQVASAIVRHLEVELLAGESADAGLARYLRGRDLLLVLDNFEHVLEAAPLVTEVLAAAPGLTVLVTSREPLRLRGERRFPLGPLELPSDSNGDPALVAVAPAVALFAAIAHASDPGFALTERNLPSVVDVCRRLDGLPLAIELAAARLEVLSASELATRLRRAPTDVGPASRDAPARQRTLTATLDWSYGLLAADEAAAFTAFAVFAGGATLDAAEAVTGASSDVLGALAAKNLLVAPRDREASRRLTMLHTVREFARERLDGSGLAQTVRRRHLEFFLALAEHHSSRLRRSDAAESFAVLDAELDNFRTAIGWAVESRAPEPGLRLVTALNDYWIRRDHREQVGHWFSELFGLPHDTIAPPVRAAALASHAQHTSPPAASETAARASLELWRAIGDPSGLARATAVLARALLVQHDVENAYACAQDAARLAHSAGVTQTRADAMRTMAASAPTLQEALALTDELAADMRATGNLRDVGWMQSDLSYTAVFHGNPAVAAELSAQALEVGRTCDEPKLVALALGNGGLAALLTGDLRSALQAFADQLELIDRHAYDDLLFEMLGGLAAIAALEAHDQLAAILSGAAGAAQGVHDPVIAQQIDALAFAPARDRLGQDRWRRSEHTGAAFERQQALQSAADAVALLRRRSARALQ